MNTNFSAKIAFCKYTRDGIIAYQAKIRVYSDIAGKSGIWDKWLSSEETKEEAEKIVVSKFRNELLSHGMPILSLENLGFLTQSAFENF